VKTLKTFVVVLGLGVLVIQVFRPDRTNPKTDPARAIEAVLTPPSDVAHIIERSCGDCHSNRTAWPWYTNVAPVSWFVANHVHSGRRALNFSDWVDYPADRQARKLGAICNEVKEGNMPLGSYLLIHGNAKMSDAEKEVLCAWTDATRKRLGQPQ
jgi:hypothetical protein